MDTRWKVEVEVTRTYKRSESIEFISVEKRKKRKENKQIALGNNVEILIQNKFETEHVQKERVFSFYILLFCFKYSPFLEHMVST